MKEPVQNQSMSSGNMSKLNTGTLQKGIIGPVLVNAINNSPAPPTPPSPTTFLDREGIVLFFVP